MLRRLGSHSLVYVLAMLLSRGLAFLLVPLYTRHLTPADYGILGICSATTSILGMMLAFSLPAAVTLFYFKRERHEYQALLRTLWVWLLFIPILAILALEWLGPLTTNRFLPAAPWHPYLRLAAWIAYFTIGPEIALALLRAEQKSFQYACLMLGTFLLTAALVIYYVVVKGQGALGSLKAQLIAGALVATAAHAVVLSRCGLRARPWLSPAALRDSLRLCIPYMPHALGIWAINVSDRWILGHFLPMSVLGVYNVGYTLGMIVYPFGMAVIIAYGPIYYQMADQSGFRAQLPRLLYSHLTFITAIALAVCLFAPEVLRIMTRPQYYGAAKLIPWIALSYWAYSGFYLLSATVIENNLRTKWMVLISAPAALLNIGINWVLIPRVGAMAAAISTLVAFSVMAALGLALSQRLDRLPFPWLPLSAMLILYVATYLVGRQWLTLSWLPGAVFAKSCLFLAAGLVSVQLGGFRLRDLWALRPGAPRTEVAPI